MYEAFSEKSFLTSTLAGCLREYREPSYYYLWKAVPITGCLFLNSSFKPIIEIKMKKT